MALPGNYCSLPKCSYDRPAVGTPSIRGRETQQNRIQNSAILQNRDMRFTLNGISLENFFYGNFTWAKAYENYTETRRVP